MRIVLDLQACQIAAHPQPLIALIQALILAAKDSTVELIPVLNLQLEHKQLQQALEKVMPRKQIHGYSLPDDNGQRWMRNWHLALREHFIFALKPDLVYLPIPPAPASPQHGGALFEIGDWGQNVRTVLHLLHDHSASSGGSLQINADNAKWQYQELPLLQQAVLLITESANSSTSLARLLAPIPVANIGIGLTRSFLQAQQDQVANAHARIILLPRGAHQFALLREVLEALEQDADGDNWRLIALGAHSVDEQQQMREIANRHTASTTAAIPADFVQFAQAHSDAERVSLLQKTALLLCDEHTALEHGELGLQAMACGVVVLCEQQVALADLLPVSGEQFCTRYDKRNMNTWRQRIARLLREEPLRREIGAASQRIALAQKVEHCAQQLFAALTTNIPAAAPALPAPAAAAHLGARPRLAYVSPLPPQKSGIADYSVELIPELARYFEVELVLDQPAVEIGWLGEQFVQRDIAWFEAHASDYAHVLYHIGNSPAHQHMFALAEKHPGVIVLHDFYLGNILNHLDLTKYVRQAFMRALYLSHGFSAIYAQQNMGFTESIWHYPCNKALLDQADGVIVHSHFPTQLAQQWYGPGFGKNWQVLPLLRGKPAHLAQMDDSARAAARQAARTQSGFAEQDFVLCSFGLLGPTKSNQQVLQSWLASPLAQDVHCHLVFVGENDAHQYGLDLQQQINQATAQHDNPRIRITGYVSHEQYCAWALAADAAVQLRCNSRGETSAAVLDCLLYGLPTVINAHGSNAEIPSEVVLKLADTASNEEIAAAFTTLWQQPAQRQALTQAAQRYIDTVHAPYQVGREYRRALQHFSKYGRRGHYNALLQTINQAVGEASPGEDEWLAFSSALASNQAPLKTRQVFVDISAMVQTDLKTGIQRVVRSILLALLADTPPGYRIEPVYTRGQGQPYYYARSYMEKMLDCKPIGIEDCPVNARQGDIFIGLDLFMDGVTQNRAVLQAYRQRGIEVYFIVYDILPVQMPKMFPVVTEPVFTQWLRDITLLSDGICCISRAVADDLALWLQSNKPARKQPLQLGYFHLGADINASAPSTGLPENAQQIRQAMRDRPSFLMVGTVEPRKGYAQALSALEELWRQGVDVNYVIVGKAGWLVEHITSRLQQHPESGKRLFWLPGVSDEMLLTVYQSCSALLAASEGEGFGLPLIEAAQHGLPVIARKIPVFEEVMGDAAFYFEGMEARDLADAIQVWLALDKTGQAPQSKDLPWLTWQQSAAQLKELVFGQRWYKTVAAE